MSLKDFLDLVGHVLEAIDELLGEDTETGGNPPPEVSVHEKAMAEWPRDEQQPPAASVQPQFEGHSYPLGGDRA